MSNIPPPVIVFSKDEMRNLANQMRRNALDDPTQEAPEYAKDDQEFEEVRTYVSKNPKDALKFTRFVLWGTKSCSFSLTFEQHTSPHRWHLSMVENRPKKDHVEYHKIPDEPASEVAEVFLGEGFVEIENESKMIPEIRHFIKEEG